MFNSPIVLSEDEDSVPSSSNKHDVSNASSIPGVDSKCSDRKRNKKPTLLLVDKTTPKEKQKTKTARKKRATNKNEKLEAIPFWINSPRDVREIPAHVKLVCDRLIHVEKQIKRFCSERQGLLSALWKLKGEGYQSLFPDPILKSLTVNEDEERHQYEEKVNDEGNEDETEEKLEYNEEDQSKSSGQEDKLWQSTWLSNESQMTPTRTPTLKKRTNSSWSRKMESPCDIGVSTSIKDSELGSYSVRSDEMNELAEYTKEPIEFFKNLDFSALSQADINSWRKFFGLKKMVDSELIRELKKIRDYLAFLNPFKFFSSQEASKKKEVDFAEYDQSQISKTVNLPKNIWPSIPEVNEAGIERQKRVQKYWEDENVYHKICEFKFYKHVMRPKKFKDVIPYFKIIYDGPPYANGRPHFGHFLNKTIKDVFVRFFLLQGRIPLMIPGWDCHGMPIEHKILKMYNSEDKLSECNKRMMEEYNVKEPEEPEEPVEYPEPIKNLLRTYIGDDYRESEEDHKRRLEYIKEEEEMEENERYRNCTEEEINMKKWSEFVRDKCKEFAYRSLKTQMNYFKKGGIWAFWDYYYATYHSAFEKDVLEAFMNLKENNHIYQARLPQLFSSKSKSVLAESEILHRTEKVLTTYVAFKVDLESSTSIVLNSLKRKMEELGIKDLKLVAYTTSGYTIPGNKGLAINKKGRYHLYQKGDCLYIMNDFILNNEEDEFWSTFRHIESVESLGNEASSTSSMGEMSEGDGDSNTNINANDYADGLMFRIADVLHNGGKNGNGKNGNYFVDGYVLEDLEYYDPMYGNKYRVYAEDFVDTNKGTGIVHLSPAHGFEDFECIKKDPRLKEAQKNGPLEYCNLFDENEVYYPHIHYHLEGVNIRNVDENVLYGLIGDNLIRCEYRNKEVEIDWRCENQVHTRLTNQYCIALPPKEEIMELMKSINITPSSGERYLKNIINARTRDWCISRQRFWGTPIPYQGNECMLESTSASCEDADRLWKRSTKALDIVDIWFEAALVRQHTLQVANSIMNKMMYNRGSRDVTDFTTMLETAKKYVIEGQDQHRGWFQSLLIVGMLLDKGKVPFDNLFSHLFVTVNGQKLSKSKMNTNLTTAEEGTRQLVRINRDIHKMNIMETKNINQNRKVDEELKKIEDTITPGHDVCNLLNPNHPKLTELNSQGDSAVSMNTNQLDEGSTENPDEYGDYEQLKRLMGVDVGDGSSGADRLMDGVDGNRTHEANVSKLLEEGRTKLLHRKKSDSNGDDLSNMYFNVDVLRTLACNNDFLTHDLDLTKDTLRSSKQTHKKIVNCFKYITSILAQNKKGYREKVKPGTPREIGGYDKGGGNVRIGITITNPLVVHNATRIPEKRNRAYKNYKLNALDTYFLNLAYSLAKQSKEAYRRGQFFKVLGLAERFMTNLSNLYFSYIKNFIYILPLSHEKSKAIKYVLNKVLYTLMKVLAPIMPHTCEDLFMTLNPDKVSLFEEKWPRRPKMLPNMNNEMGIALTIRKMINKDQANANRTLRLEEKILKLEENHLTSVLPKLESLGVDLRLMFNVSGVELCKKLDEAVESLDVKYKLEESGYRKCKRCWLYRGDVEENQLCEQCRQTMELQVRGAQNH
ncbi:isoleucyl-tRNA synthetase [Theileria orientalis]|uniref:Isoleucyl-tRNA synthetase n=1 Tax=Theileria orientalis TaxID=68886 RepID=A0A976M8K5_THEOR|nr:isoleucyl-tRNA synthetase [Theileria orientalis]